MNVKVEELSSIKKKLSIEIPADQVKEQIDLAYQQIGKNARLKGFRKGKIPAGLLRRHFAPQMQEQVLDQLIKDGFVRAMAEHRIHAVSSPEIVDLSAIEEGAPFTFSAHVEVKPEPEAKDYTGLKVEREKFVFDAKVIDERLEEMRSARANLEVTSRKVARSGDFAIIDFEGFADGKPIEGGKGGDYQLELGSNSFIPGFEDNVIGMKREQVKEFEVGFPEEYGNKELAGKPATFKVTLTEIKERVVPDLDDEFAKEVGLDSLEELRGKIEENFRAQEEARIAEDAREKLMDALIEKNPIEVPDAMVQRQLEYMLENASNRLRMQGMSLEMLGLDSESFKGQYRESAVKQVQGSLLLEAVARQEKIEVADDEIDGKMQEIADQVNATVEDVRKQYGSPEARANLVNHLVEEKAIEFLFEQAKVKEVTAKADDKASGADKKPAAKKTAAAKKTTTTKKSTTATKAPAKKTATKKTTAKDKE